MCLHITISTILNISAICGRFGEFQVSTDSSEKFQGAETPFTQPHIKTITQNHTKLHNITQKHVNMYYLD